MSYVSTRRSENSPEDAEENELRTPIGDGQPKGEKSKRACQRLTAPELADRYQYPDGSAG